MIPRSIRRLDGILRQNEEDLLDVFPARLERRQILQPLHSQRDPGPACVSSNSRVTRWATLDKNTGSMVP